VGDAPSSRVEGTVELAQADSSRPVAMAPSNRDPVEPRGVYA
jgi:hypothetical protein